MKFKTLLGTIATAATLAFASGCDDEVQRPQVNFIPIREHSRYTETITLGTNIYGVNYIEQRRGTNRIVLTTITNQENNAVINLAQNSRYQKGKVHFIDEENYENDELYSVTVSTGMKFNRITKTDIENDESMKKIFENACRFYGITRKELQRVAEEKAKERERIDSESRSNALNIFTNIPYVVPKLEDTIQQ